MVTRFFSDSAVCPVSGRLTTAPVGMSGVSCASGSSPVSVSEPSLSMSVPSPPPVPRTVSSVASASVSSTSSRVSSSSWVLSAASSAAGSSGSGSSRPERISASACPTACGSCPISVLFIITVAVSPSSSSSSSGSQSSVPRDTCSACAAWNLCSSAAALWTVTTLAGCATSLPSPISPSAANVWMMLSFLHSSGTVSSPSFSTVYGPTS